MSTETTSTNMNAIEARISVDLAQFDPVEAQIAKLREEYKDLRINGHEDKDGRKMVHAAWQVLRDVRLGAEKLHKALKEDALKYTQALDARKRQVVGAVSPMEEQFYADWKAFDAAVENRKREEAERAERERVAKLEGRKQAMFAVGLGFNGTHYVSKFASVDTVNTAMLERGTDEQFDEVLDRIRQQIADAMAAEQRAEEERQEAVRKAQEETRRLQEVAEAQTKREAELRAREEALRRSIAEARTNEAMSIGAQPGDIPAQVHELSEEQWASALNAIRATVQDRKEAEARRIAAEEAARQEREARIAAEAAQRERERIEREAAEQKAAEEERLLRAGDVAQFEVLAQYLANTPWPKKLRSAASRETLAAVRTNVTAALALLNVSVVKDME